MTYTLQFITDPEKGNDRLLIFKESLKDYSSQFCEWPAGLDVDTDVDLDATVGFVIFDDVLVQPEKSAELFLALTFFAEEGGEGPKILLDLREEYLESLVDDSENETIFHLMVSVASTLLCDSEVAQEMVYNRTGILATIISTPLTKAEQDTLLESSKTLDNTDEVLWYGSIKDLFNIKKEFYQHPEIHLLTRTIKPRIPLSEEEKKNRIKIYKDSEQKQDLLENAFSIVYLPPSFTEEGEFRRLSSIKECVQAGNLVFAPRAVTEFAITTPYTNFQEVKDFLNEKTREELQTLLTEKLKHLLEKKDKTTIYNTLVSTLLSTMEYQEIDERKDSYDGSC